ncbi:hypothetical protein JRO89_XS04G0142000 [Xanthoceras sorbifolium]|uniref:Ycf36 n=1 Tax=Xanthoceras sorbifolium TaxID=99658 RepID=A0ABQ8I577_9ROSI|nr:hypothetical protein JRO89_XS04G0142000 [Xanthoceras sorbifolium]
MNASRRRARNSLDGLFDKNRVWFENNSEILVNMQESPDENFSRKKSVWLCSKYIRPRPQGWMGFLLSSMITWVVLT